MTTRIVILNAGPMAVKVSVESAEGLPLPNTPIVLVPGSFTEQLYVHLYQRIVVTELDYS